MFVHGLVDYLLALCCKNQRLKAPKSAGTLINIRYQNVLTVLLSIMANYVAYSSIHAFIFTVALQINNNLSRIIPIYIYVCSYMYCM